MKHTLTPRFARLPILFLLLLAVTSAFAQSAPIWTGSISCQLDDEEQGAYQRQEIQTWTLTGAPPENPNAIPIYQATWRAQAQGQLLRTQGTQTASIQWVANVPSPGGQAPVVPIAIRVSGDRLVIGQWRASMNAPNALNGQRQIFVNGVPQGQPVAFSRGLQEWKFPLIEASATDSMVTGTSQTQADAGTAEVVHRYGGALPPATCQWKFTRGTSGSQPPVTGTRPMVAPGVMGKSVPGVASGQQQNVASQATIALDTNSVSCGTNPAIGITGTLTHFVKDVTTVDFGPGILVDAVEVTSEKNLRVYPEILLDTSPGTHPVTVRTNGEVVQLAGGLTVTSPCHALPTVPLQTVIPSRGQPGQQGLSVEITARDGHFKSGTTVADFGPGITVASLTVNSASSATAVINIDSTADNRTRTLTLTTNNNVASLTPGFIVQVPVFIGMNPKTVSCGQNPDFIITGHGTHFVKDVTTVDFGPGIVVDAIQVTSATVLHAYPEILVSASPGTHPVTVRTNDEVVELTGGLTVNSPCQDLPRVPVQTVIPSEGQPGQQGVSVQITARDGHFKQGTTVADFGPGITVASLTINSSSNATAVINIDANADNQTRTLTLTTNNNLASITPGFNVRVPVYIGLSPQTVACGQNPDFLITGHGTHFAKDVTTVDFGPGIVVDGVVVGSPTKLNVYPEILLSANSGTRTVTVTTGAEVVHLNDRLTITSPCSALPNLPLRSVTPNSGQQGQQNLSVAIQAKDGFFKQGTTGADFGPGITVQSLTINSSNDATALVSIDSGATTGARTVRITTNNNSLTGGFTVDLASHIGAGNVGANSVIPNGSTAGPGGPVSLTASSSGNGSGSVAMTPVGTACGTNCMQYSPGTTVTVIAVPNSGSTFDSFSGGGCASNNPCSFTITASTTVTAAFTLNSSSSGSTGSTGSTGSSGSTGLPVATGTTHVASMGLLTGISPATNSGQQNVTVTLTGQLTNFVDGKTTVSFARTSQPGPSVNVNAAVMKNLSPSGPPPVQVGTVKVNSKTSATVALSMNPSTAAGTYTVTATTPTSSGTPDVVTLNNAFTVTPTVTLTATTLTPAPATLTVAPASGSYLVTVTSLRCGRPTLDDPLQLDGKGDEIYASAFVRHYDRRNSQLLDLVYPTTQIYGDANQSTRVQSGTRSNLGGIQGRDIIPDYPSDAPVDRANIPAKSDLFPLKLWQGTMTDGVDVLVVSPSIWESDGNLTLFNRWVQNQINLNQTLISAKPVQDQINNKQFGYFKLGNVSEGTTNINTNGWETAGILALDAIFAIPSVDLPVNTAKDRPIGLAPNDMNSSALPNTTVVLTREIIEAALNGPSTTVYNYFIPNVMATPQLIVVPKPGIMVIVFSDTAAVTGNVPIFLGDGPASYAMILQVERM